MNINVYITGFGRKRKSIFPPSLHPFLNNSRLVARAVFILMQISFQPLFSFVCASNSANESGTDWFIIFTLREMNISSFLMHKLVNSCIWRHNFRCFVCSSVCSRCWFRETHNENTVFSSLFWLVDEICFYSEGFCLPGINFLQFVH